MTRTRTLRFNLCLSLLKDQSIILLSLIIFASYRFPGGLNFKQEADGQASFRNLVMTGEVLDRLAKTPQDAVKFYVLASKKNKAPIPQIRGVWVDCATFSLCWQSKDLSSDFEKFSIHDISEVRRGAKHKDFQSSHAYDIVKGNHHLCFTILYGKNFRLKSLSLVARNTAAYDRWVNTLEELYRIRFENSIGNPRAELKYYSNDGITKQFLESGFRSLKKEYVNIKDFQNFLRSSGLKTERQHVKKLFESVVGDSNLVSKDGFIKLYRAALKQPVAELLFATISRSDGRVCVPELKSWLQNEQNDPRATDTDYVKKIMKSFVNPDIKKSSNELYWNIYEFMDYLYSCENDIYNESADMVDDMDRPLSHYLISSSHNTYLMGDQLRSESSVEAYIRALRMNCRCIELDIWDGNNGEPIVTHGNTLCTSVPFRDILEAINDHAWDTSDYPLILSLENHCSAPCQQIMADLFKEIMGDSIQSVIIDPTPGAPLPSPNDLKRKILLKDKKNNNASLHGAISQDGISIMGQLMAKDSNSSMNDDVDVGDLKNGHLYMRFADQEFMMYYFVVHSTYIEYVDVDVGMDADEDEDDDDSLIDGHEDFYGELWFHPNECGRTESLAILRKANIHGAFLVRTRSTYPYYALSYWDRMNLDQHVLLRTSPEEQEKKEYWLVDTPRFSSMLDLIEYYKSNPLMTADGDEIVLTQPLGAVPVLVNDQGNSLYDWYDPTMGKEQAEYHLKRTVKDGSFLVRKATDDPNAFTISFRAGRGIKHCRLQREGRFFVVGPGLKRFENIPELIEHYRKKRLYRKTKLTTAINKQSAQNPGAETSHELYMQTYCDTNYVDITQEGMTSMYEVVRAKYDFQSDEKKKLSFTKGTMIRVVCKDDGLWWRGECPGGAEGLFPSTYVEAAVKDKGDVLVQTEDGEPVTRRIMLNADVVVKKIDFYQFEVSTPLRETFVIATAPTEESAPPDSETQIDGWVAAIKQKYSKEQVQETSSGLMTAVSTTPRSQLRVPDLSNLISYFQSVRFTSHKDADKRNVGWNVSSFAEHMARKLGSAFTTPTIEFNIRQFSRVYPRGRRVDSSNYDPMTLWMYGYQLVALNYQTPGRHMLSNRGLFRLNHNSGCVLKPQAMLNKGTTFDPEDFTTFNHEKYNGLQPVKITIEILAGKHLNTIKGTPTPFIDLEVVGTPIDQEQKFRTTGKATSSTVNNGLCPQWENETFTMAILFPDIAMLRFSIMDDGVFGEPTALAYACVPVRCLREGVRSVPLENGLGERLELSALLVRVYKEPHILTIEEKVPYSAMRTDDDLDEINKEIARITSNRTIALATGDTSVIQTFDDEIKALFAKAKRIRRESANASGIKFASTSTPSSTQNSLRGRSSIGSGKQRDSSKSNGSALSVKSNKSAQRSVSAGREEKKPSKLNSIQDQPRNAYVDALTVEEFSSKKTSSKKGVNGHAFKTVSVGAPCPCGYCKKSIIGSIRSTSRCTNKGCLVLVHKKCREFIGPCPQ
eukprot:CFRG0559T1